MTGRHLGLILPNYGPAFDPERLALAALAAEEAGFDSGWVTDHVMVPAAQAPIYGTISEALVSLGFLAGRTGRLRLGVSALITPQRDPMLTLKQLVSLDVLSGGRLVVAVAAGWLAGEFATLGARFEGRGRRLDDWLERAAGLFAQDPGPVRRAGAAPAPDAWLAPAPVGPGGPELWVAGVSRWTLDRAARTGVWHPVALPLGELRAMATEFRRRRADGRVVLRIGAYLAREPDEQAVDERGRLALAGPPEWLAERLADYLAAGADGFVVNLDHRQPGLDERARRFAAEVWPLVPE